MAIAIEANMPERSVLDLVLVGLLHDAEESITADLPALVKAHTDWDPVKAKARAELFDGAGKGLSIPKNAHYSADGSDIVKAADLLSALVYANEEIETHNNNGFKQIRLELIGSLDKLSKKDISPSIQRAIRTIVTDMGFKFEDGCARPTEMSHF